MQVRVLYFGMLKDLAGREREVVRLADGARLQDLYQELQSRFPKLQALSSSLALAVNHEYCDGAVALRDNDEVALIPPVSGGAGEVLAADSVLTGHHARLVREPISSSAVTSEIKRPQDGAIVDFDGIVRNNSNGRSTLYLDYSAYEPMALRQMEELANLALAGFAIRDVRLIHRLGRLQIGESSVYIVVASEHRAPAFEACRWLIDTLKKTVPIWKKEYFADGAVWADGEPFPPGVPIAGGSASK